MTREQREVLKAVLLEAKAQAEAKARAMTRSQDVEEED